MLARLRALSLSKPEMRCVAAKAGPPKKWMEPSRSRSGPCLAPYSAMNSTSIPCCLKKPSFTAAVATKYEGES